MTAVYRGPVASFLLRAGLLTATLAIIAGIFGMHIMTGAHNMTGAHDIPGAGAEPVMGQTQSPTGHAGHGPAWPPDAAAAGNAVSGSSSSCASAGTCPTMSATDAACVLAPGNTSLAAALPGAASYAVPVFGGAAVISTNYSYSPDGPSPGDLCISRT